MYALAVTFQIKSGQMEAFMPLMRQNAQTSLQIEPGCHRFDICTDPDRPDEVFLYELYTDKAAFQAHLDNAHFKAFDQQVAAMIARKEVRGFAQVQS